MQDPDKFPIVPPQTYVYGASELVSLPDPWLRIWAIHLSQTTRMSIPDACWHVRNQLWQEDVLRWSELASSDLCATWRGEGLHAAWFDLQLALHDLKRAIWQAIPKPVRDFYTRHEDTILTWFVVPATVLLLYVTIIWPVFLSGGD